MEYIYDDGGRKESGYRGKVEDCVIRAIAIVSEKSYKEIYNDFSDLMKFWQYRRLYTFESKSHRSPRYGVPKKITRDWLSGNGFVWHPTMTIGSGCKVHLRSDELPVGRLLVQCSKHLTAVIDGVIHDIYDPSRDETRCVYGYWTKPTL